MSTLAQIVERTKVHLTGGFRGELTLTTLAVDAVLTTIEVAPKPATLQTSSIISIDQELMYVLAVDSTGLILTVIRGHMGTTAASHVISSVVEVNARFPGALIWLALLDEISGLPEFLYAVRSESYSGIQFQETITLNANPIDYSLAMGLIDVRRSPLATYGFNYPIIAYTSWPRDENARLVIDADPGDFANGCYLRLGDRLGYGGLIRITVALRPDTTGLTGTSDLTTTIGLLDSMKDVLALGTALRLYSPRDIDRTNRQGQGETRFAQEVPVGGVTQTASGLARIYAKRLGEELDKLRIRHPIRQSFH